MKVILAAVILLSPTLCRAQDSRAAKSAPDEAYTARLVRLVESLQKNPWQGWKAGTVVVVRYLGDAGTSKGTFAYVQPDLVYKVLETDKLFGRTQEVKGKSFLQEFFVKDQRGLDAAHDWGKDTAAADVELDGFTLAGRLSELRMEMFPGGTSITRQWSLSGRPSILLRQETNGGGWRITSAKASKKIGERGFECVEIKTRMRFYSGGPAEVLTTQYLSPEVPGHSVEEIQEFYRVGRKGELTPFMIIHQKVVELKIQ